MVQALLFDNFHQEGKAFLEISCTESHQPFALRLAMRPSRPASALAFVRMIQVRHRSHATHSRQPRQVRKEATVTGSCVCSGSPVPGLILLL